MRHIPDVTLVLLAGNYVALSEADLADVRSRFTFDDVLVFAEREMSVRTVVAPMTTPEDYYRVVWREVYQRTATKHVLMMDWDGYPVWDRWLPAFLEYDFIGAVWPWFTERTVGNTGFSLQSRRFLKLMCEGAVRAEHPGDISICRDHRSYLEEQCDIRFAPEHVADLFSVEHGPGQPQSFGFHGVWNMLYFLDDDAVMARLALLDDVQWKKPHVDVLMFRALIAGRRGLYRRVLAERRGRE